MVHGLSVNGTAMSSLLRVSLCQARVHKALVLSAMVGTTKELRASAAAARVMRITSKEPVKLNGVIACIVPEGLDFLPIYGRAPEVNCCTL